MRQTDRPTTLTDDTQADALLLSVYVPVVYNGPADAMLSYFSELGHACPKVMMDDASYYHSWLGHDKSL